MGQVIIKIIFFVLMAATINACDGINHSTAINGIEYKNEQLKELDAPIRIAYKEGKEGVSYHPYLLGKISHSVATNPQAPTLMRDTLKSIWEKGKNKSVTLVQTRHLVYNSKEVDVKEVWVIKTEDNDMYAYTVSFKQVGDGVDIYLSKGYKVFDPMLKKK